MQISGIILAGGKSQRMGTDKALLEIDGVRLLLKAIELCQSFCDEVLISSNSGEHKTDKIPVIEDEIKDCGPMGGIYSCLKKSKNNWNFVISVDSPFVTKDFAEFLCDNTSDFDVVMPTHSKGNEPLIALYHKNVIPEMESQLKSGNFRIQFLLQKLKTNVVFSDEWLKKYPRLFYNLNYPEDLKLESQ